MIYSYPMLTEMELSRKFVIDVVSLLNGQEDLFLQHGFDIDTDVQTFLFNAVADIVELDELDDLIIDICDILYDIGYIVAFTNKGYSIEHIRTSIW